MMNIVEYLDWQTGKGMKGEDGLKYLNDNQYVDKILLNDNQYVDKILREILEKNGLPITGTTIGKQFKQI